MNHALFEAHRNRIQQQLDGGRLREALDGAQELLRRTRAAGERAYPGADFDLAIACILLARVLETACGSEKALPLLDEAQKRFEAIANERVSKAAEGMANVYITERGDCLLDLGRLDEAAPTYEEGIRRAEKLGANRGVAVVKGQLGTIRLLQGRYKEALEAHQEARELFKRLGEPGSVAVSWHQIGNVYQAAGQPEAAEDAYRKSLAISVQLGNTAHQAGTLTQLGNLYRALSRFEDAAAFYRQAVDKSVESGDVAKEGLRRNNLADVLCKLRRFDEARQEICRAIECGAKFGHTSEQWKTWYTLTRIEKDAGNPAAAAEAKRKAIACYLAYRRDGGENHNPDGRICLAVTQQLLAGKPAEAASLLQELAANPNLPARLLTFIQALQAIVAGSRDRTLADSPDLHFSMAAEILFLIETLEKPRRR